MNQQELIASGALTQPIVMGEGELINPQTIPVLKIERLPGGFVVTKHAMPFSPMRREVVPNADALVSAVREWAEKAT